MLDTRTPEGQFFSWLASASDRAEYLLPLLPPECFSPEGQQRLQQMRSGVPSPGDGTPVNEPEALSFLRNQLLALIGRAAGRAQRTGRTEPVQAAVSVLLECLDGFTRPPLESYAEATPCLREFLPTGIAGLDAQISGLAWGELGIVAAPPGRGKTAILINFAVSALQAGYSVLYISVADQGQDELIPRFDSAILREACPSDLTEAALQARHQQAARQVPGTLWLSDYTAQECRLQDIERTIRECETDLVIVDHADDVLGPHSQDPSITRHSLRVIYLALKRLAVEFHVPIWTASQTHEQSWGYSSLGVDGLAEAKTGKATGVAICLLFSGGTPEIPGRMWCTIAKARRRYTQRVIQIHYDHPTCSISTCSIW